MFDGLDPRRVMQAMTENGIANANQLAKKCGVNRSSALGWTKGRMPTGHHLSILSSVLGKSPAWLAGAPVAADMRARIARAVRAELGEHGECPEADIVEAFGAFTFEQRKLLVQIILHGAGKLENVVTLADARPPSNPEPGSHEHPRQRRGHR